MHRRRTIGEERWPETPDFVAIITTWREDASTFLLRFIWQAYDLLRNEVLSDVDFTQAEDDLERSITQYLEPRIHRVMTGDEPFYVQHSPKEDETRKAPPAQPPLYDIAFALNQNPRIMWPLEAKVLKTESSIAHYIDDIQNQFILCRYAPFSSEGGMLGYLLSGEPAKVFDNIEAKLSCVLHSHLAFFDRDHKISEHNRMVDEWKPYPQKFRCHHLILQLQASEASR